MVLPGVVVPFAWREQVTSILDGMMRERLPELVLWGSGALMEL